MESRNPQLDAPPDEAVAKYVRQTGMATDEQIEAARKLAPTPLAEALIRNGVITPTQREAVEKKLEGQRTGELGGYRLVRKLGEGGMGAVYLAEEAGTRRKVALKVLPKKNAADPEFLRRFRREAEAATTLDHPNIVRAFSAGEEKGYHFYVMEYCEGEPLRKKIDRQKFLPHAEAVEVVLQAARGLLYAHGRGFIHRDVKPENIMITTSGVARLLDLGLTKNVAETTDSLRTVTGAALGTPHYISPEQARGDKNIDGRTDIYSLGATFYHALTGRTPFGGNSIFEVIQKHLMEQLLDPRDLRPEIPAGVVDVVRKMMAKSPDDRYRDCGGAIADLERVREKQPPAARAIDPALSSIAGPTILVRPASKRRNVLLAGVVASAVLLIAAIAIVAWPTPSPAPPSPTSKSPAAAKRPEDSRPPPPKADPETPKGTTPPPSTVLTRGPTELPFDARHPQNPDAPPGTKWLELLSVVDVDRHSVNGRWERTPEGIVSPATGTNANSSRIWLPYALPDEYELILYVERAEGSEDLVLGFSARGRQFALAIDGWLERGSSGAFLRQSNWTQDREAPVHVIPNNTSTRISCFVRGTGISLRVDGKPQLAYPDVSALGMPENLKCFNQTDGFVIGTVRSRFKITSVALLPIKGGSGKVIK